MDEAYGDDDRLLEILLNDLEQLNMYEVSKGKYDLKIMERFVESLQNFVSQVETVGMGKDLNGRMLLTQVRHKLPEEHRIQFLQSVSESKTNDSIQGLIQWLHKHLVLLQKVRAPEQQSNKPNKFIPKSSKSVSHSTVSPGDQQDKVNNNSHTQKNVMTRIPKCPLHPEMSSHFIKGCYKFRGLPQKEKFDIMNANQICHRCGHNNCVAGKPPYKQENCQFIANCQIPTCGMNTHFASICPCVYGLDGYRHSDRKLIQLNSAMIPGECRVSNLDATATEFKPDQKHSTVGTLKTDNSVPEGNRISCVLPTVMGYLIHGSKKKLVRILLDTGCQISLVREDIIPRSHGGHIYARF